VEAHDLAAADRDPPAQVVVLGVAERDAEVQSVAPSAEEDLHEDAAARLRRLRRAHEQRRGMEAHAHGGEPGPTEENATGDVPGHRGYLACISGLARHSPATRAATLTGPPGVTREAAS